MESYERIIVALDVNTVERAAELVTQLRGTVGVFKVGLELTTSAGIGVFDALRKAGAERFFFDAKLHDIPNTVAGAMRGVVRLGAWCVTVHASGGSAMLRVAAEAAKDEAERLGIPAPKILAVTLLTSVGEDALRTELRVESSVESYVAWLAHMAHVSGCDGVIASPHEIAAVRMAVSDPGFLVVTPGVRPAGSDKGDQSRVMTPREAMRQGADYLVIGRPIVAAPDPAQSARMIAAELNGKSV